MANFVGDKSFDPKYIQVLLGGVRAKDFADGDAIVLSRTENAGLPKVGITGGVSMAYNNNKLGTLTLRFLGASDTNKILSQWYTIADKTQVAWFPVAFNDPYSGAKILATEGFIQKTPTFTGNNEVPVMEWEIGIVNADLAFDTATASIQALQIV